MVIGDDDEAMPVEYNSSVFPKSPLDEVGGVPYFVRMCDKIRLQSKNELHADYLPNMGGGFDKWTCEFLNISYDSLVEKINGGLDDEAALSWAISTGGERSDTELDWWLSYMRNRGFRDDLSAVLDKKKSENGLEDRDDIVSFFGLIDADEGRI